MSREEEPLDACPLVPEAFVKSLRVDEGDTYRAQRGDLSLAKKTSRQVHEFDESRANKRIATRFSMMSP